MLFVSATRINAQIEVDFSTESQDGCAPFIVQFINQSPNNSNFTYLWDFGNGNTSTLRNPIASYTLAGDYSVSLTIYEYGQNKVHLKENFIRVHTPPTVNFTPDTAIAKCAPFTTQFTSQTLPKADEGKYTWDFGDGVFSHDQHPSHTYHQAGVHNVTLIFEDINGCINEATHENIITSKKPTAIFEVKKRLSCNNTLNTSFTNQSYGIGDLSYYWNFGDHNTATIKNPTHEYKEAGMYDISLTVIDDLGCKDSITFENLIEITNTLASFTLTKDTVCPTTAIQFTNTSINNRTNTWHFGDGNTSTEVNPKHIYTEPGDYTVELHIENYECSSVFTRDIHVENVNVDFLISDNFSCKVPIDITYTPKGDGLKSYNWDFGSGQNSSKKTPTHTYSLTQKLSENNTQSYNTTLTVVSNYGCSKKITKNNIFNVTLPKVSITADNPTAGCTPLDINFGHKQTYNTALDKITSVQWKVDDETTSNDHSFQRSFNDVGKYKVYLSAKTELGCTANSNINIAVGQKVKPDFKVNDKKVFCASEIVQFTDMTKNAPIFENVTWYFGDGEQSEMGIPIHQYTDTGYMNVMLEVSHNGCISSNTQNKALYIKGPIAKFTRTPNCDSPYKADFLVNLVDADSYTFYFGDGDSIKNTGNIISHSYHNKGIHSPTLHAYNNETQCSFSYKNNIIISDPQAIFDTTGTGPCTNTELTFDPKDTQDASIFEHNGLNKQFLWDFGDNSPKEFTNEPIVHKYNNNGTYHAKLVVKDRNNCPDTLLREITIYKPHCDFTSDYLEGCIPAKFKFTNLSSHQLPITKWEWDFGDGHKSNIENPTHDYEAFGNYSIRLTASNERGCKSTSLLTEGIKVADPDANFAVSDTDACIHDTLMFFDTSKSNIANFLWEFGDGNTSTLRNPRHTYHASGNYDITLNIVDEHGCELTHRSLAYINIEEPPKATFTSLIQESHCYPFPVLFTNQTNYNDTGAQKWIFGDNLTSSSLENPQHIYTKPGNYDVSLIAYSANGCADTLTQKDFIRIKGPYAEIVLADTACIHNEISFSLQNEQNISSIIWDFGDGNTSSELSTWHKYMRKGTLYTSLILKTNSNIACNKVIQDSIFISQLTANLSYADDIKTGCIPLNINLTNNSHNAETYQWDSGSGFTSKATHPSFSYLADGNFNITLIANDNFGCSDTITDTVTAYPLPTIHMSKDTLICLGDNLELLATGGLKYNWDNNQYLDNANIDNPIATPKNSTSFKVQVTDENNCLNVDSVFVKVQQEPAVNLKDSTIIIGESVQVNIEDADIKTYLWEEHEGISCSHCPNPILSPLENTTFSVSVSDTNDCFTNDYTTKITVEKKYSVDVPTAFTPNDDNINDVIYVKGWGIKKIIFFRVFNRWGQIVFESDDINIGWNGKFKGNPQASDTYTYAVQVETYKNTVIEKKGSIKLIR